MSETPTRLSRSSAVVAPASSTTASADESGRIGQPEGQAFSFPTGSAASSVSPALSPSPDDTAPHPAVHDAAAHDPCPGEVLLLLGKAPHVWAAAAGALLDDFERAAVAFDYARARITRPNLVKPYELARERARNALMRALSGCIVDALTPRGESAAPRSAPLPPLDAALASVAAKLDSPTPSEKERGYSPVSLLAVALASMWEDGRLEKVLKRPSVPYAHALEEAAREWNEGPGAYLASIGAKDSAPHVERFEQFACRLLGILSDMVVSDSIDAIVAHATEAAAPVVKRVRAEARRDIDHARTVAQGAQARIDSALAQCAAWERDAAEHETHASAPDAHEPIVQLNAASLLRHQAITVRKLLGGGR